MRGVVLAGGKSERMGRDKVLMEYEGKTLVEYSLDAISILDDNPLVISNSREVASFLKDVEVVPDLLMGRGPLGGIHTALRTAEDDIFVVACDTPLLSKETVKNLADKKGYAQIAVYISDGKLFPIPAFYGLSLIDVIETRLEGAGQDLSLQDLIRSTEKTAYIEIEENVETLIGINTPEDYRRVTGHDVDFLS